MSATPTEPSSAAAAVRVPSSPRIWLHPLCFAVFPLLSLYAANVQRIPYTDAFRPLVVTLGGALLLWALVFALVRQAGRTALLLTTGLFLFFSYGHLTDFVVNNGWDSSPQGLTSLHAWLLPIYAVLFVIGAVSALRVRPANVAIANSVLNVVGGVLVLLPVLTIANTARENHGLLGPPRAHRESTDPITAAIARAKPDANPPSASAPDIYYIILDAYGREDVLKQFYGYSNRPFLDALRRRGFFVAGRARPNYGQTIESLSSSLNMTYLDAVVAKVGTHSNNYAPLTEMVDKNAVVEALKPHGYHFVAINTGFSLTVPKSADPLLARVGMPNPSALTAFDVLALNMTPFVMFPQKEASLYDQHRSEILEGFHDLAQIPRLPYRKFVFVHILAPHPPFVFGANDEPVQENRPYSIADGSDYMRRGKRPAYLAQYIAQLQGINKLVLQAVDSVYAASSVRPIIIIQGDHGPRMFLDWQSLKKSDIRETYGNLNAFELPDGKAPEVFYDDITPVNSFRLLLNHEFHTGLPRLPDRSFYATLDDPYDFTDVTDRLPRTLGSR